jgi:hypothetical protein
MATNSDQPRRPEPTYRRRRVRRIGFALLVFVLCLFLPAGTWMWTKGWLFILVVVVNSVLGTLYLSRVNPDVIAARVSRHQGAKRWDRQLRAIFPPSILAILILASLLSS